jgi:hypothetical protein
MDVINVRNTVKILSLDESPMIMITPVDEALSVRGVFRVCGQPAVLLLVRLTKGQFAS